MKRTRRALALLLMLAALLSLAPLAAQADPPQEECREGGEHIWDLYEDSATCTESGTRVWRCRKCGIWWQETSPALGHAWNEGVLIQEEGLLGPQKMHYYCWRCGATWDEYFQPSGSAVLEELRNSASEATDQLVITLQPVGGVLSDEADASHTMTVAAKGGVEPYTYEWRGVDKGVTEYLDGNPVGYAVHSNSRRAVEEANRRRAAFYEQYLKFSLEHSGVEDQEGAERSWTELQIREYGDIELSHGEDPSYTAEIGECFYYCIVRDSAGQSVESERAYVASALYISRQPEDTRLEDGKAYLVCQAQGGSGKYSFDWYLGDLNHPLDQHAYVAILTEEGDYFCVVNDGNQEATSFTATVDREKSGAAPVITLQPKSVTLSVKSSNHYNTMLSCKAKLSDGSSGELIYRWQKRGSSGWHTIQNGSKTTLSLSGKSTKISGQYRCIVRNPENGKTTVSNTATVQVKLSCSNFRFKGKSLIARIRGGTPPYTVVILQHRPNDKVHPTIKLFTLKVGSSGKLSKLLAPQKFRYYSYSAQVNGQWVVRKARAYYSIIVYDSSGQVYESGKIVYPK